jgi:hypothetical protein
VEAADLVVGDLVMLKDGDRISADLELLEAHSLSVDTSTLTGESVATSPQPGETVFAGTFVLEGDGVGVVTATGAATRLGSNCPDDARSASPTNSLGSGTQSCRSCNRSGGFSRRCCVSDDRRTSGYPAQRWLFVRCRRDCSPRAGGFAADCDTSARYGSATQGGSTRASAETGIRGNAGLHDFHLYRQDRNVDTEQNVSARGLDTTWFGSDRWSGI